MMHEVASHGGGMAAASPVHINLFGPHPIVVHGTHEQKQRWVPRLVAGEDQCCFGFTEPDAGLNTTRIKTFAEKVPGGYLVHGQKVWTSTAQVANKIMLLTRTTKFEDCKRPTDGITIFYTDLDRARSRSAASRRWAARRWIPTRSSSTACSFRRRTGSARRARASPTSSTASIPSASWSRSRRSASARTRCAARREYARERVVFDRPIGQNQGIQHPLAERWMYLEAAWLMAMRAAWLYDTGKPCGAEANGAKFLGARAGHDAAWQAVVTHGGLGYAKEYHVERLFREVAI